MTTAHEKFKMNHPELQNRIQCEICDGSYIYFSRWQHERTKKHIKAYNNEKLMKQEHDKGQVVRLDEKTIMMKENGEWKKYNIY